MISRPRVEEGPLRSWIELWAPAYCRIHRRDKNLRGTFPASGPVLQSWHSGSHCRHHTLRKMNSWLPTSLSECARPSSRLENCRHSRRQCNASSLRGYEHCSQRGCAFDGSRWAIGDGHDPQQSAWNFKGPGKWLWDLRLLVYRWLKRGIHHSSEMQIAALDSEIHHNPGDGVTRQLFESVLAPMGFDIEIYPHNHGLGNEVLQGRWGRSEFKYRLGQRLSFIDPNSRRGALSLMCIARRTLTGTANPR
jgi:hypothetical protein